jgi:hypothetical protein
MAATSEIRSVYSDEFESMSGVRKNEGILREKVGKPHFWGATSRLGLQEFYFPTPAFSV